MNKVIALKPNVNVRRGMNTGASILGSLNNGEQLDLVKGPLKGRNEVEQWAQVIWPKDLSAIAYICLKMANGTEMCRVEADIQPAESADYQRGWNDCLERIHLELVKLRK